MTQAEKEHMDKVAQLPCIVCGYWPVEVHHAGTGSGGRRNHMRVLPLCCNHHRGFVGLHTLGRKAWQARFGTEAKLLERVSKLLEAA